jgi:endonuclease YncB( thermonuclease family)
MRWPTTIIAATVTLVSPALAVECPRGALTGEVTYVRDGDTIEVGGGMAIRFWGIGAPESDAPGGTEATDAIKALVLGREVRCELTGKRTDDRCVGVCYLGACPSNRVLLDP